MKTDKELLTLLLETVKKHLSPETILGLCACINDMHYGGVIDIRDCFRLHALIGKARPTPITFRYWWVKIFYPRYYWKPGSKAPRIRWLKQQIKKLS